MKKSTILVLFMICVVVSPTVHALENGDSWKHGDLKILDSWGDTNSPGHDIVAAYQKENSDSYIFRIDFLNLLSDSLSNVYFLLDYAGGGNRTVTLNNTTINADVNWDVLVAISAANPGTLYDTEYNEHSDSLIQSSYDSKLDFLEFSISKELFDQQDSLLLQMQVFAFDPAFPNSVDETTGFTSTDTTGRVKVVLSFMNAFIGYGPHAVSWYDGYGLQYRDRYERGGLKSLVDAVEKYELPLTINDLRIEQLPGN